MEETFERTKFEVESEIFMEDNHIYQTFQRLTQQLILEKPDNPLSFMLRELQNPSGKLIFLVGQPGQSLEETAKALAQKGDAEFISIGGYLREKNPKNSEVKRMVSDEKAIEAFEKQFKAIEDKERTVIIEGFPRTVKQALYLKNKGVMPDALIVANQSQVHSISSLQERGGLSLAQAQESLQEFALRFKSVLEFYRKSVQQVDLDQFVNDQDGLLEKLARVSNYPVKDYQPKRYISVLVQGPPGSGKTRLSRAISQKLKMAYISQEEVVSQFCQKRLRSEEGQAIRDKLAKGEEVESELINSIMVTRLMQPDCKKMGVVLDSYPSNEEQISYLENSCGIYFNHVIMLKGNEGVFQERLAQKGLTEEQIRNRSSQFGDCAKGLKEIYGTRVAEVEAEREFSQVLEEVHHLLHKGC